MFDVAVINHHYSNAYLQCSQSHLAITNRQASVGNLKVVPCWGVSEYDRLQTYGLIVRDDMTEQVTIVVDKCIVR